MNVKHLFVIFSLIGWSIALAAIYQWSQPATTPLVKAGPQPVIQSSPAEKNQAEQPTQYLLPPDNGYRAEQPQFYPTPFYKREQPKVVEM